MVKNSMYLFGVYNEIHKGELAKWDVGSVRIASTNNWNRKDFLQGAELVMVSGPEWMVQPDPEDFYGKNDCRQGNSKNGHRYTVGFKYM